jgi:small subunit ribosomal protein S4
MSRFRGPKGKIVRRFGLNLYGNPKFDKLLSQRPNPPGQHGSSHARKKVSDYGLQLIEKQKLKYCYGVSERQFRNYFKRGLHSPGITGDNLIILLETRLDNVVFRAGMGSTRDAARQLVLHGHVKVNGRRVNIASFQMRAGDVISVKNSSKSQDLVRRQFEDTAHRETVDWAIADREQLKVTFERIPLREELQSIANEQLVVELYSK